MTNIDAIKLRLYPQAMFICVVRMSLAWWESIFHSLTLLHGLSPHTCQCSHSHVGSIMSHVHAFTRACAHALDLSRKFIRARQKHEQGTYNFCV